MTEFAALLLAVERGDPAAMAAFRRRLRAWRAGPLVPLTAGAYRRARRDALLAELAAAVAPAGAGPATRARRALDRLAAFRADWPRLALAPRGALTAAEAACVALLELGEPLPRERMLRGLLARMSATDRAATAETIDRRRPAADDRRTMNERKGDDAAA